MGSIILIHSDGSYKTGKAGYCFSYFQQNKESEVTYVFGKCKAMSSIEAELIAVTKALEYCRQFIGGKDDNRYILGIDVLSIFKFITKKVYKTLDRCGWNYSDGNPRKQNVEMLKHLADLYEMFPDGTLILKKVKTKKGYNHQVDKIARFILNKELVDEECSFITRNIDYNSLISGVVRQVNPTKIIINKSTVTEFENIKLNKKIDWTTLSVKNKIESIAVDDIEVTEHEHLRCMSINLNGTLSRLKKGNSIIKPIAVRRIENSDKYYLVAGITRMFTCKIMDINIIPAIIVDMGHKEFMEQYGI